MQEDFKFESSLSNLERSYLKIKDKKGKRFISVSRSWVQSPALKQGHPCQGFFAMKHKQGSQEGPCQHPSCTMLVLDSSSSLPEHLSALREWFQVFIQIVYKSLSVHFLRHIWRIKTVKLMEPQNSLSWEGLMLCWGQRVLACAKPVTGA